LSGIPLLFPALFDPSPKAKGSEQSYPTQAKTGLEWGTQHS
jgi:hypothetical protein